MRFVVYQLMSACLIKAVWAKFDLLNISLLLSDVLYNHSIAAQAPAQTRVNVYGQVVLTANGCPLISPLQCVRLPSGQEEEEHRQTNLGNIPKEEHLP